jgi:predicted AAA+ superfamily ATPase
MSVPTIKQYFSILDDTLVIERVEPYLKNMRKRILASPRYYFFDLGLRNSLASMPMKTGSTPANKGQLFEHAVVLEIIRRIRVLRKRWKVCFWRTHAGAEVDCIVDMGEKVIPIEIKSGKSVRLSDLKGLTNFLADYPKAAKHGYVIFQGDYPEKISENITAVPWNRF